MKRLLTTLAQKWPEYLLEVLVITIGILGAFTLNNWNEERKSSSSEFQSLLDLKDEFNLNQASFQNNLSFKIRTRARWRDYFEVINNQRLSDKERAVSRPIAATAKFMPVNSKLNSLLSSGKIENIRNDSLQNQLLSWPHVFTIYNMFEDMQGNWVGEHLQRLELELVPITRRDSMAYLSDQFPLNNYSDQLVLDAQKDMRYQNALLNNYHLLNKQIESAETINRNFITILRLLDEEISNREQE